jgi:secreted PhoX family phosphatase
VSRHDGVERRRVTNPRAAAAAPGGGPRRRRSRFNSRAVRPSTSHAAGAAPGGLSRRAFIQTGLAAAGTVALGPAFWRDALAAPAVPGPGPYGAPAAANEFGIAVPEGFTCRMVAKGGAPLPGTDYDFPIFPDGSATYPLSDGGWILAVNAEIPVHRDMPIPPVGGGTQRGGGVSAIRFGPDGSVRDAYRILSGTSTNCAGGKTPWGTWLSCEEVDDGLVYECDPTGENAPAARPFMGTFKHEAVCVDPNGKRLYLTEDVGDGGFYRFTPDDYPNLSSGPLEIAYVDANGGVHWTRVPDPSAATTPTRKQVAMTEFRRGEGIWFDSGIVYVATTSDNKIHAYDPLTETIEVVYDQKVGDGPLNGVDNVTAAPSGDIYVCEDNGTNQLDIGILTPEGQVARFLTASGPQHEQSELAGVCFDPSGKRMYFGAQRSLGGGGALFEVTGPFRDRQSTGGGGSAPSGNRPAPVGGGLRLRAHAGRTGSLDRFRRTGVAIEVTASHDVDVVAKVVATIDGRPTTLARTKAALEAGQPQRIQLRPSRATGGRLAGMTDLAAELTASAKHAGTGTSDRLTRPIRFVRSKRAAGR